MRDKVGKSLPRDTRKGDGPYSIHRKLAHAKGEGGKREANVARPLSKMLDEGGLVPIP